MQVWKKLSGQPEFEGVEIVGSWESDHPLLKTLLKNYKGEIMITTTKQRVKVGDWIMRLESGVWHGMPKELFEVMISPTKEIVVKYGDGGVTIENENEEVIEVLFPGS